MQSVKTGPAFQSDSNQLDLTHGTSHAHDTGVPSAVQSPSSLAAFTQPISFREFSFPYSGPLVVEAACYLTQDYFRGPSLWCQLHKAQAKNTERSNFFGTTFRNQI